MNFQSFMNNFQQFSKNPSQFVIDQMGIPKDIANNPDAIIQKMMNDGRITQSQYDAARNTAMQMQKNPMFQQFMK